MKTAQWFLFCLLAGVLSTPAHASPSKVTWKAHLEPADARAGEGAQVVVEAQIEFGWHIYSIHPPKDLGPKPTTMELAAGKSLRAAGGPVEPKAKKVHDEGFGIDVGEFPGAVAFGLPVTIPAGASGKQSAAVKVNYQTCMAGECMPPRTDEVPVSFTVAAGAARSDRLKPVTRIPKQPAGYAAEETHRIVPVLAGIGSPPGGGNLAIGIQIRNAQSKGLFAFLWFSLGMGLLALLTPCVFPMVPITVSFFAKQQETRPGSGLRSALFYCLGIISTFTLLGVVVSALFGAGKIAQFAAHPITNLAFGVFFIVMAANLFGAFEIILPSWLLEKTQARPGQGGVAGPMLMGLTFTLMSFTCTVAFVGSVLVTTTQGSYLWPILGMLAFSTAFSSPFFLLALFPQWLSRLPKGGGWLSNVKAYMGFLELAAALKFLSNADLVWNLEWITRPVFLSIWFAIFMLAGCHLMGWLRLPQDQGVDIGPLRRGFAVVTFVVGGAFLAALNGVSLGQVDAFPPLASYGMRQVALNPGDIRWYESYDQAVAAARDEKKPIFIDFTGVTCTNCRLMEKNVFTRPEVASELKNFITARLYTDKETPESERYQKMQEQRFGQTTLPLYVVLDPAADHQLGEHAYDTNVGGFVDFLRNSRTGLGPVARN